MRGGGDQGIEHHALKPFANHSCVQFCDCFSTADLAVSVRVSYVKKVLGFHLLRCRLGVDGLSVGTPVLSLTMNEDSGP
jgi:hypothetical protein